VACNAGFPNLQGKGWKYSNGCNSLLAAVWSDQLMSGNRVIGNRDLRWE